MGKLSKGDANGNTAPSTFEWTYSLTGDEYAGSTKSLRVDASDKIYAVVGQYSAAVKLNADGSEVWKTG